MLPNGGEVESSPRIGPDGQLLYHGHLEGIKSHLDLQQILPGRLRDTEHSDDTDRLELEDVLHVDALYVSYRSLGLWLA